MCRYFRLALVCGVIAICTIASCGCAGPGKWSRDTPDSLREYGYQPGCPIQISRHSILSADEVLSVFLNHLFLPTGQKLESVSFGLPMVGSKQQDASYLVYSTELDITFILHFRIDREKKTGVHPFKIRPPAGMVVKF